MFEKLGGDDRADRVATVVLRTGGATPVAEKSRHGVGAAWLQLSAQHVSFDHDISIADGKSLLAYGPAHKGPNAACDVTTPDTVNKAMSSSVDALILDLLEWIGPTPRPYASVQEAWRTSCPKLPVWEDATDAQLVRVQSEPGAGIQVAVTPSGVDLLRSHGRGDAFAA